MKSGNRKFKFPVSVLIGSNPATILRTIKGYRIDRRYYPKFILTFFLALLFSLPNLFERMVYKRRKKTILRREPPLFIIGFWRSGTTMLHSVLCQDTHAAYVTTFHAVFPNLVLTQNRWIKAPLNLILPRKRPFDGYAMDMDFPQEEDFAMMALHGKSIYKMFYFPKDVDAIYHGELFFEKYTQKERRRWEADYLSLIDKALLNTGGVRYISKNPCNIFRIRTLTKLFPEAKFIFIYRNPYTVVESLYRFINEVLPGSELQHREGGIPREQAALLYNDAMNEYLNMRDRINPDQLYEISYEEFKERPIGIIQDIYTKFNLPGIEDSVPRMKSYLAMNSPETREAYAVDRETYRLVNDRAGDIVNHFGYPPVFTEESSDRR